MEEEALGVIEKYDIKLPPQEKRIRIGIVGEIYVVMEPSINGNIEEILNSLGAETERSLIYQPISMKPSFPGLAERRRKNLLKRPADI